MAGYCFACNRANLIPSQNDMNDPAHFCGGIAICTCDDDLDLSIGGCPQCGNAAYPCPCGGDGVLPEHQVMMEAYASTIYG